MRVILNIIFALVLITELNAQISRDSLIHTPTSFSGKLINSNFEKKLNIYTLRSLIKYNFSLGNLYLGFKEDFGSTIISSANKNIRDEHYFSFLSEYELTPMLKLGLTLNNDIYSDNRSLDINQVSVSQSTVYSRFTPYERIDIVPFAGISVNKQIGEMDNGYIYGAEIGIDTLQFSDVSITSIARFSNEDISPRQNLNRLATVNFFNQYDNSMMNMLTASYIEQKKDFYFSTDSLTQRYFDITNNIQSRTEKSYFIQDQLILYQANSNFLIHFFGRIDWRNIDRNTRYVNVENVNTNSFDTNIDEYKINFISSLQYNFKSLSAQLRISYLEREEKHSAKEIEGANRIYFERRGELEFQKNNKSQQTTLSLSGQYRISDNDRLSASILHRKITYDTPSDQNYDDRDELLTIFELEYLRKINAMMDVFLKLDGSVNHLVYIFAERSSNNNIRRVLSFTSGTSFRGQKFRNLLSASVMADYTVYDFKEFNPFLRNFSFRRFSVSDSLNYNFTPRISLDMEGYIRFSEQGDFNWDNFSNNPSRYLEEIFIEPIVRYSYNKYSLGAGLKYFTISTFGYQKLEKYLQNSYSSFGPTAEFMMRNGQNLSVLVRGWYEFIKQENLSDTENVNFIIRLNLTL